MKLFCRAAAAFVVGLLFVALLLFVPAGTIRYPQGWMLIGVVFVPMLIAGVALLMGNPQLMEKRLKSKETQGEQKTVVLLSAVMFIFGFGLAGLDFRFGWTMLPGRISWAAAVVCLLGYLLYAQVLRENAYASRVIEVQEGQKLIDTGLYGVVRHPMYSATVILFLSMPLVLGSLLSFLCFLGYPLLIAKRIRHEELLLEAELNGYAAYKARVRYRLIPFIW